MREYHFWPVAFPAENAKVEQAFGKFILTWGVLERELDSALTVILGINPVLGICVHANLNTKAKLDILSSSISVLGAVLPKRLITRAHRVIEEIRDRSGNDRNLIAHGQPFPFFRDRESADFSWAWLRISARKNLDLVVHPSNPGGWRTRTKQVTRLIIRWVKVVEAVQKSLSELSADDLDRRIELTIREHVPAPRRRRKRPSPKKHGSPAHPSSRG